MSLHKTYRVECNGPQLVAHLRRQGIPQPWSWADHAQFGPAADESQKARRDAIRDGWRRDPRDMPIFRDQPNGQTSRITYDLCPSCSEQIPAQS